MFRTVTGLVSGLEIDGTMILICVWMRLRGFVAGRRSRQKSCNVLVVLA